MTVLRVAFRYFRTRRIALICVLSVMVGVAALIVVMALMSGVQRFLVEYIKQTRADLEIEALGAGVGREHLAYVQAALRPEMESASAGDQAGGGPIRALAPRYVAEALIAPGRNPGREADDRVQIIHLVGIDFPAELRLGHLDAMLAAVEDEGLRVPDAARADALAPGAEPAIILGDALARRLGVARLAGPGVPTHVKAVVQRRTQGTGDEAANEPGEQVFRVVGCFSSGQEDYDASFAYVDLQALRAMRFEVPEIRRDCRTVLGALVDPSRVGEVARHLRKKYPNLLIRTWEEESRDELLVIQDQKRIFALILGAIVLFSCVAIVGLVWMLVTEKVRDVGILRSMGLGRARVVMVFTAYGLLLSLAGSVLGLLAGIQLTRHLDDLVGGLSGLLGIDLVSAEVYNFERLPTHIDPEDVTVILALVVAAGFLSSVIPAARAAFMTPVRCLRSD